MKKSISVLVLGLAMALPLAADEFGDAAMAFCERMQSCALERMDGEDIPPEAREMMLPALEAMCTQMQQQITDVPTGHPLYPSAVACMRSMATLSCDVMQDHDEMLTPECQEHEKLADKYLEEN